MSGVLGYISNFERLLSGAKDCRPDYPGIVERLYLAHGRGMVPRLEGVYTCFVYDATVGRLLAFQDEWSSDMLLYYAVWGNRLSFSTSLRLLLSRCEIPRAFNLAAARRQIFYKVVPTRETLVGGVAKLCPGEMLLYDLATARLRVERVPRVPWGPARSSRSRTSAEASKARAGGRAAVPVGARAPSGEP